MSHSSHGDGPAGPGHTHGVIDPSITTTRRGMWAISWSFAALMVTALLQVLVVVLSDSVALLADTIHNFGDAATAIPLYVAFAFARLRPNERFSYGYGRVEDLAGAAIVLIILFSAIVAGYESVDRLLHPRPVGYLGAVAAAALIGFVGNEAVAVFRIRVGKEIGSAALVADGYHARVDGLTSLAVLLGALGVATAWSAYLVYVFVTGRGLELADLVGQILGMGPGSWWLLTALTVVLGILVGAVGALTGYTGSRLIVWAESPAVAEPPKG